MKDWLIYRLKYYRYTFFLASLNCCYSPESLRSAGLYRVFLVVLRIFPGFSRYIDYVLHAIFPNSFGIVP